MNGRLMGLRGLAGTHGLRIALVGSVLFWWAQLCLTGRWAHVPGSLHGWRLPLAITLLALLSWLALRGRALGGASGLLRPEAGAIAAGGLLLLAAAFFVWFPFEDWRRIPFLDNWPPRFVSTTMAVDLLRHGTLTGWNWHFLGGYPFATDVTQHHGLLALLPMTLFGPPVGFHVLHLALFAGLPLLTWLDLRDEGPEVAWVAAGLVAAISANYSYFLIRSGDTNSLAGVLCTVLALTGSHAAARGRRWGAPALVLGLALSAYAHAGFFWYAVFYLVLEAAWCRDVARLGRAAIAVAAALVASLPTNWENWRHPAWFVVNNAAIDPSAVSWAEQVRKLYYNVELLVLPGRWFNDYTGLAVAASPVLAWIAWRDRSRVGLHAALALATLALTRLDGPMFGYIFLRPIHMWPWFVGAALGGFAVRYAGSRALAWVLVAWVGLYIQVWWQRVPHVDSLRDFDAALVDHVASLDGHLVAFENSPHRNVSADPARWSVKTPFAAHFEPLLPAATGRRLYAGFWDGWQWVPWRADILAGGTWRGRPLPEVPPGEIAAELRRWGVRHVVVWSAPARAAFDAAPGFARRWHDREWVAYELLDADARAVVTPNGAGTLDSLTPLSARVVLDARARTGDEAIVRARFHPSWRAEDEGGAGVGLRERDGQIAFTVPRDGAQVVHLRYRTLPWLWAVAAVAVGMGSAGARAIGRPRRDRRAGAVLPDTGLQGR